MDKNTLLGMLLMGAVIFGFMWLNKPSEEELARQREIAEQQEAARLEAAQAAQVLTLDSVSAAERATIASTIRRFGTADSLTGAYTLDAREAHLTLSPEGAIGGIVDTDFGPVAAADIIAARYDGIPQQTAAAAVSNLKQSMAAVARYQGFARYLKGKESTVTLSNPDVTLEISTKGGAISKAWLNNYKSYDSTALTLMDPATDGYSFMLTTATQRLDTREFYFTPVAEGDSAVTMMLDLGDGAAGDSAIHSRPKAIQPAWRSCRSACSRSYRRAWHRSTSTGIRRCAATKPDACLRNVTAHSTTCLPTAMWRISAREAPSAKR